MKPRTCHVAFLGALAVFCHVAGATGGVLSGLGTASSPYLVADYADLRVIGGSTYSNKATYRLVADIDASTSRSSHGDSGFAPIVLHGSFHGGGHSISGLVIRRTGEEYIGFLRYLDTTSVLDSLVLVGARISGSTSVGALVSYNDGAIVRCFVTGNVAGDSGSHVGGLVGRNSTTGRIVKCGFRGDSVSTGRDGAAGGVVGMSVGSVQASSATAIVAGNGDNLNLGGVAGLSAGRIDSCSSGGRVDAEGDSIIAGGLVGYSGGIVRSCNASSSVRVDGVAAKVGGLVGFGGGDSTTACWATGNVVASDGDAFAGGLVGTAIAGVVRQCYATGTVTAQGRRAEAGGLVGYLGRQGSIEDGHASGDVVGKGGDEFLGGIAGSGLGPIMRAYATGRIVGSVSALTGGVVGYADSTVSSCHWNMEKSGEESGVGVARTGIVLSTTGLSSAQMRSASNFAGWDFGAVWELSAGDSAPHLRALASSYSRVGVGDRSALRASAAPFHWRMTGRTLTVLGEGALELSLLDVSGREVASVSGTGALDVEIPRGSLFVANVRSSRGATSILVNPLR